MAVATGERKSIIAGLMPFGGETAVVIGKMLRLHERQGPGGTLVFGMTVSQAGHLVASRHYHAMELVGALEFLRHVTVAIQAEVGQSLTFKWVRVAGIALPGEIGMRKHATKWSQPWLII